MVKPIVKDEFFLRQKSTEATKDDLQVVEDLKDTLKANIKHCVGIAANMIGVSKRIIIVTMGPAMIVMINPVILKKEMPYEAEESCLSLSGLRKTTRYASIEVEYYNEKWQKVRQKHTGWTAQIIQHEMDHLEGILI